jgi:formamidopyrimidine-DNA glycosylase
MPELPDIETYLHCLAPRLLRRHLRQLRIRSPFVLRSVDPPPSEAEGRRFRSLSRLGKRICIGLEGELHVVIHLMIAGRLRWRERRGAAPVKLPGKLGLAAFDLDHGTLLLTEAGSKKRASLHLVRGVAGLAAHDPGGLELLDEATTWRDFRAALTRESHTLKRALTDPRLISGVGNAYSDEILHRARLSPFKRAVALDDEETRRLFEAAREVLTTWTARLEQEAGEGFPEKVTAFREDFAVHGKHRQPCPTCGAPVQRIVYAANEANYCPGCQTGGRVLADRSLSRLLKEDWPRTLEELEAKPGLGRR